MQKDPTKFQLLVAKNAFAAIAVFAILLVPLELVVSRYLLKSGSDIVGVLFVSIITGSLLHRQLARKYKDHLQGR